MFDTLSQRLQKTFAFLRSKGKISEGDLEIALKEIRLSLLEADVSFKIVKDFIEAIRSKALGADVMKSLTPGQQIIKIVHDELVNLLGGASAKLSFSAKPTVVLLSGLQGSGKTTNAAKLALWTRKKMGKKTLLVAADTQRPAAIEQLTQLGKEIDVEVYSENPENGARRISGNGVKYGRQNAFDLIIVDTAGRLHIDEDLMVELSDIKKETKPHHVFLVVDAMTGQDAVKVASVFNEEVGIDGIIMTKLDGDARGGAALSVKNVTGQPIRFVSSGEKLPAFEVFHPDRMASRILGMGDVLTLIEKAEETMEKENAENLQQKMLKGEFDLKDFLTQLRQIKKMGSVSSVLKMLPGMPGMKNLNSLNIDDGQLIRTESIILSMTPRERSNPSILNGSRKERIAKGSGTNVYEINNLLKSFEQSKKMIKKLTSGGMMGKLSKGIPFFK